METETEGKERGRGEGRHMTSIVSSIRTEAVGQNMSHDCAQAGTLASSALQGPR